MKNIKRISALFLIFIMIIGLCACGEKLNGRYTSESGYYYVEFNKDGSCTWYQDGTFFNGTYRKIGGEWQLNVNGRGIYDNTVFMAEKDGKGLVISGGVLYNEYFYK